MNRLVVLVLVLVFVFFLKSNFNQSKFFKSNFNEPELVKSNFLRVKGKQLQGVDCIYVITMPQRKEYIKKQMDILGFETVYFDAVKPSDLTRDDYDRLSNINNPHSYIFRKYTRLCVLLSFVKCFMDALDKGYKTIIIFEDDITINVNPETLTRSVQEFNKSICDVFYMGYCFLNCGQLVNNNYRFLVELTDRNLLCCHSMCIKTHILPALIKYCFPMNFNSDELFRNFYISNGIRVCVPKKVYFTQNRKSLESLNESVEDPKLFDVCSF